MTTLTDKFDELETQLAAQNATIAGYVDTVETKLQAVLDFMDIINENAAANTKYLLQAIAANDPCSCTLAPVIQVPPPGSVAIGVSSDQCKRIQAFLHTMQEIFTVLDAASAFSVGLNFTLLYNSINEVINSIESGSDLPIISYSEAVNLVGAMINYIAGNLLVGGDLSTYFAGILLDLRSGMALGTSATAMKGLYDGIVNSSSLPGYVKPVIIGAAYNALYSYYFDPGTSPNLTGYDGSLCGGNLTDITECTDFYSALVTAGAHDYQAVILPPHYGTDPNYIEGDFYHWTFQLFDIATGHQMGIYWYDATHSGVLYHSINTDTGVYTITDHTFAIALFGIDTDSAALSYRVRICPPS